MKFSFRIPKISFTGQSERSSRTRTFVCPIREWGIGLLMSVCIFLILAGYAGYNFYTQSNTVGVTPELDESTITYRERSVERALATYRMREEEFTQLRGTQIAVPPKVEPEKTVSESEPEEAPLAEPPVSE